MALVAKSYQDLEIVRDTYIENGKRYCDVRTKDGKIKRVIRAGISVRRI